MAQNPIHKRDKDRASAKFKKRLLTHIDERQTDLKARSDAQEISIRTLNAARLMNVITAAGVLVAVGSVIVSAYYTRQTIIEANRAWLYFTQPQMTFNFLGQNKYSNSQTLSISNIGNGPASEVASYFEPFWFTPQGLKVDGFRFSIDASRQIFPPNTTCENIPEDVNRGMQWPKSPPTPTNGGDPIPAIPEFFTGMKIYAVHGCIRYKTFGKIHHTRFCEFLTPELPKSFRFWRWAICAGAAQNKAD